MISLSEYFDRLNSFLDKLPGNKNLKPQDVAEKKYMFIQGIMANVFLVALAIVSWSVSAKLILEFSIIYLVIMLVGMLFFTYPKRITNSILAFKIIMIVISSVYIMRMGGLYTSGGLFLLAIQAVTSTIILRNFRRTFIVVSIFTVSMALLIAFQSRFPTENALTFKQNSIIFPMFLFGVTTYIFFFSLYAVNLFTSIEQRETQRQKDLNDAKTRLYTNITHEFRTPLTVILGMADSVKEKDQENNSREMNSIIKNGKNLLQLVDQMLDLSKLESGRMSVNKINANIIPFLKYVFQLQEFYAEEKNIRMLFTSGSQSYDVEFDPEKISAIVTNLLSNAIKFTPDGGQISMKVYKADPNLCIEIKDNGIGIAHEKLETIFDRFYQVDSGNTRKEGGAGIGLALTREFVALLEGEIDVASNPGIGTAFTVRLPYIPAGEKAAVSMEEMNEAYTQDNNFDFDNSVQVNSDGNQRLLIIEDNQDVVVYLKACYQNHFSICVAKDGKEGLTMAVEEIPDVIISDIMMPEMDGFELCKRLKEDYRTSHIPIILLTAKADIPSRIEGLETGADAFIVKPFNQRELLIRMQKLLELRRKLFQRYSNGNGLESSSDPVIQKEDLFFKKLNEIILKNLGDEFFNIQNLCGEMGMSKSQLYRKFKALTNKSVAKYIRSLRMKKAKELLQSSSLNITEVSFNVGIKTLSTFSQLFREEFGESPREFVSHFQKKASN
jgi:signal transduction histidine kinase/DNA-binding response OmpR family regulator